MRHLGKSVATLGVLCALLSALPAWGQGGPPPENGIKVGDGRVHPYFDLELRFDSAAIFDAGQTFADFLTHFRPGLRMEVPGSSVYLNLNGFADYVLYPGFLSATTRAASHLEGGVNLDLSFNQSGAVEFRVQDHFARTDRTSNPALSVGVISLFNEAKVSLPIHPGGGALEVSPGASFTVEFFDLLVADLPTVDQPRSFNYTELGFQLGARYKFLPKTALVLDADFSMPSFQAGNQEMLLKAAAGLSGLVSQKVAVLAKVGWGHSFTGVAKTVIGHLELSYLPSQTASLKLGYLRTLEPIALFKTYGDDRAYIEGRALLGGRLTLRGYAALDFLTYYEGAGGSDTNVRIDVGPEYQFTRWLGGSAGYVLTVRTTSRATALTYDRHEGYVRISLMY